MQVLADRGCEIFLEIGPSPTLIGLGRRALRKRTSGGCLRCDRDPAYRVPRTTGNRCLIAWVSCTCRGAKLDWAGFDRPYARRRVSLPTYPFQRGRYWFGIAPDASTADPEYRVPRAGPSRNGSDPHAGAPHPLLGRRLIAAVREQVFEGSFRCIGRPLWPITRSRARRSCPARPTWKWPWRPALLCMASLGACATCRWWNR